MNHREIEELLEDGAVAAKQMKQLDTKRKVTNQ